MESRERNQTVDGVSEPNVDWSRYGLGNGGNRRPSRRETEGYEEFGPEMYQSTGANELFAQEHVRNLFKKFQVRNVFFFIFNFTWIYISSFTFSLNLFYPEFRSVVEIKLFHISTSPIRNLGWRLHFLPD